MPTPEGAQRVLQAIQEYLAEPGESPLKDTLQQVLPEVQAAVGEGGMEGAPPEGDPLAALMAAGEPGTPMPGEGQAPMAPSGQGDIVEEEMPDEGPAKTYEGARAGALKDLETKGDMPQSRKRKRRG